MSEQVLVSVASFWRERAREKEGEGGREREGEREREREREGEREREREREGEREHTCIPDSVRTFQPGHPGAAPLPTRCTLPAAHTRTASRASCESRSCRWKRRRQKGGRGPVAGWAASRSGTAPPGRPGRAPEAEGCRKRPPGPLSRPPEKIQPPKKWMNLLSSRSTLQINRTVADLI